MGQQGKTTSDMWNHEPVITDNACSNVSDTDTDTIHRRMPRPLFTTKLVSISALKLDCYQLNFYKRKCDISKN